MLCIRPIEVSTKFVPCGQCMNCRINKQRTWASRIQLEAKWHPTSVFTTLTYDDETVPKNADYNPILKKRDLQDFIRELRRQYKSMNSTFRFFACGEYGNQTQRPHYHAILFGVGIDAEPLINEVWDKGFTQTGELLPAHCAYVAQYTIKKMNQEDSRGLNGRTPEFSSMSTRPGIGHPAIKWLKHVARTKSGMDSIYEACDVWNAIRIDGKIWPLGNYLRRKLREEIGLPHNAQERAIVLDWYDHDNGEIYELPPLPENYCPWQDIGNYETPWAITHGKKETTENLPELRQKSDHRQRQARRRKTNQTENV